MDRDAQQCTGGIDQNHHQEKETQKGKMAVRGGLINEKREKLKAKEKNERYSHLNAEFQIIARRDKKAFLSDQCKEREENNQMGKTLEISSRKLDTPKKKKKES